MVARKRSRRPSVVRHAKHQLQLSSSCRVPGHAVRSINRQDSSIVNKELRRYYKLSASTFANYFQFRTGLSAGKRQWVRQFFCSYAIGGFLQSTCAGRMSCRRVESRSVSKVDTVSFHHQHRHAPQCGERRLSAQVDCRTSKPGRLVRKNEVHLIQRQALQDYGGSAETALPCR